MSKVAKLKLAKPEPDADTVKTLKMLLRHAKAGEVQAIAYVAARRGGVYSADSCGSLNHFASLGAVHRLAHDLQRSLDAATEPDDLGDEE